MVDTALFTVQARVRVKIRVCVTGMVRVEVGVWPSVRVTVTEIVLKIGWGLRSALKFGLGLSEYFHRH